MSKLSVFRSGALALLVAVMPAPAHGQDATLDSLRTLYREGRLQEAAAAAEAAIRTRPAEAELHLIAGQALADLEEYARALPHLQQVLRLDSLRSWPSAWAHVHAGRSLFGMGDARAGEALRASLRVGGTENSARAAQRALRAFGLDSAYAGWRTVRTAHLRVHFPPDTRVPDPEAFAAGRERAYEELQRFFAARVPKHVDVFVWNDDAQAAALAALPALGFALPEYSLVHTRLDQTPGHELAHVLAHHAAGRGRRTRFVNEGAAVLFDLSSRDRLALARAAARGAGPVRILQLWDDAGRVPEALLYPVAGAFMERLLERGGRDRFVALLREQTVANARAVYGDLLDAVIAEVERDLAAAD